MVFQDANNNGRRDPGEIPVVGALVAIRLANGSTVKAKTDVHGRYEFRRVPFGVHLADVSETGTVLLKDRKLAVAGTANDLDIPVVRVGALALTGTDALRHLGFALLLIAVGLVLAISAPRRRSQLPSRIR